MSTDPPQLDYRDGHADRRHPYYWAQLWGGCAIGCFVVAVNGVNFAMSNLYYSSATQPASFETNILHWRGPFNCTLVTLLVAALVIFFCMRHGLRTFAQGLLLDIGVTLLAEGLCFVSYWR